MLFGGATIQMSRSIAGRRFQQLEAARVNPVVVGEKKPHRVRYGRVPSLSQRAKLRPIGHSPGDFFTAVLSVLVNSQRPNYRPWTGRADSFSGLTLGKICLFRLRLYRWPGVERRRLWASRVVFGTPLREGIMATALADLYGKKDFHCFDRLILADGYRPSEDEEFMCDEHRAYFLKSSRLGRRRSS